MPQAQPASLTDIQTVVICHAGGFTASFSLHLATTMFDCLD
jgi:microcystin degradation protein MlrC